MLGMSDFFLTTIFDHRIGASFRYNADKTWWRRGCCSLWVGGGKINLTSSLNNSVISPNWQGQHLATRASQAEAGLLRSGLPLLGCSLELNSWLQRWDEEVTSLSRQNTSPAVQQSHQALYVGPQRRHSSCVANAFQQR